jgi:polyphosphate kinase 2 (PPK2 family)
VFYRSWYRQAVHARLAGAFDDKRWARATDEINEFESQQRDHGTLLIKLFFHLTADEQAKRLRERREDPWRRWLVAAEQPGAPGDREQQQATWNSVLAQTDTRWAPWRIVDSSDKASAQIAALSAIVDAYAKAMPAEPPVEGDTVVYLNRPTSGRG